MTYQIGGVLILAIGVFFMIGSLPMVRFIPRPTGITAQVGTGVVNWLARGIGTILMILGVVTMLQT
jgi:hypothetical protein